MTETQALDAIQHIIDVIGDSRVKLSTLERMELAAQLLDAKRTLEMGRTTTATTIGSRGVNNYVYVPAQLPYVCPVCSGNGLRPLGFYSTVTGVWVSTTTSDTEPCQSCAGTGVIMR